MMDSTNGSPGPAIFRTLPGVTLAILTLTSGALGAQEIDDPTIVEGRVVEGRSGESMGDVAVRVVTLDGREILGSSVTDREGRYRIVLSSDPDELPGSVVVESAAMGYGTAVSEPFVLTPGGTIHRPDLVLRPDPVLLDTLQVEMRRHWSYIPPPRERVLQRQLLGKGAFIAGAVLENADELHLAHVLESRVDGLQAAPGPRGSATIESVWGARCLVLMVNQWPSSADDLDYHYRRGNIGALEIYRDFSEVPEELHRFVFDTSEERDRWDDGEDGEAEDGGEDGEAEDGAEAVPFCGLVNAWLWGDWNRGVTHP